LLHIRGTISIYNRITLIYYHNENHHLVILISSRLLTNRISCVLPRDYVRKSMAHVDHTRKSNHIMALRSIDEVWLSRPLSGASIRTLHLLNRHSAPMKPVEATRQQLEHYARLVRLPLPRALDRALRTSCLSYELLCSLFWLPGCLYILGLGHT
jgi:hypothetical protein